MDSTVAIMMPAARSLSHEPSIDVLRQRAAKAGYELNPLKGSRGYIVRSFGRVARLGDLSAVRAYLDALGAPRVSPP